MPAPEGLRQRSLLHSDPVESREPPFQIGDEYSDPTEGSVKAIIPVEWRQALWVCRALQPGRPLAATQSKPL